MIVGIEAGHGQSYRMPEVNDPGHYTERGETEHRICLTYARLLQQAFVQAGHRTVISTAGRIGDRMKMFLGRDVDVLLSLHMGYDANGVAGSRVLWATPGSKRLASSIAVSIGAACLQVEPEVGLLRLNPGLQIELGNISSDEDMRKLRGGSYAQNLVTKIVDATSRAL